ncbi:MAG: TAXI family TRAP transporter solute-binding subunit [Betaproteobacteria bacterium]
MTQLSIKHVFRAITFLIFFAIAGCGDNPGNQNSQTLNLKFVTGPQGGSWYPLGGSIKALVEQRHPGIKFQVLPGAGIANVKAIESGKAQIGLANSVSTVDGLEGRAPFTEKAQNICNIATLYPQYFQIITLPEANIRTPRDLSGKALTGQQKGNTGEAITGHLLAAYEITLDDLSRVSYGSYTDSVTLMKDGNADFYTLGTTIPAGSVMDLASARRIELLEIPDDGIEKMQTYNPGYRKGTIPKGTYPNQSKDIQTIVFATHLAARCDLAEDAVYNVLDSIFAGLGELESITVAFKGLTKEKMAADISVPMHPGARRWYDEH